MRNGAPAPSASKSAHTVTRPTFVRRLDDLPLRAAALAILTGPLLLLVVAAAASVDVADQQSTYTASSRAAVQTSDNASQVLVSLLNAETGVRGYVATGDAAFLAPWRMATSAVGGQLNTLARGTGVTPDQGRALMSTANTEMFQLHDLVAAERSPSTSRGTLDARLLVGKSLMDRIRTLVSGLQARIQAMLSHRRARVNELRTAALAIAIAGAVIGLLGVVGMFMFIRRITRRVDDARADAHRLGVGETLPLTPTAGDEIGRLSAELQQASTLLSSRGADLVRAHQSALTAAKDRGDFLTHLGHELRTPLTAIVGFGQLLQSSVKLAPADAECVDQIVRATRHMIDLTGDIDDVGLEEASLPFEPAPVPLAEIADRVSGLMRPIAATRHVRLVLDVDPDVCAYANRRRLSQVLINLVSNAIKYNRVGGEVRISSGHAPAGSLRLVVSDTGVGIRAELQPRVFAPFERLEAESGEVEGRGIGLALSRTYIEAMGGSIGLESDEGRGTTFWVELPAAETAQESRAA
jgi:signal transduction histidine kinase